MRFAGRGEGLDLTSIQLTGGPRTQSARAADNVSLGNNFGALEKRKPRYDQMAADWITNRANEDNARTEATAAIYAQGMKAASDVESAKLEAEATKKAARDQANASKTSSTIGGIASIAAAGIGLLSDETTKHTIENIENACSTLRNLRPVTFYYKDEYSPNPERLHHGFIAQEYLKVMPDATYYDEHLKKYCIDIQELIALLVSANQELETRITRLEVKNALAGVK